MVTEEKKYNTGAGFPPTNQFEGFHPDKFMKMEQIFESLKYANDLKFSEIEEEFELWEKAAKSYFPEGYTILGIKYFDNSEISMQIIKKHKIKNDAYMIIASKIDRNDDRSDILIEQKWIDRSDLLIN